MDATHPEAREVVLAGRPYTLRLGAAAFRLAQMRHGVTVSLGELMQALQGSDLSVLPRLAWIAMLPGSPEMTEEEAVVLLAQAENEGAVYDVMLGSLNRFMESIQSLKNGQGGKGRR